MKRKRQFTQYELFDWAKRNGWVLIEFHEKTMSFDKHEANENDETTECTRLEFSQISYNVFVPKYYKNYFIPDGILDYLKLQ